MILRKLLLGVSFSTLMVSTSVSAQLANDMDALFGDDGLDSMMDAPIAAPASTSRTALRPNTSSRTHNSTSGSDQDAFSSVYDYLDAEYAQREQTGMLYTNADAQGQAQGQMQGQAQTASIAAPIPSSVQAAPNSNAPTAPAGFDPFAEFESNSGLPTNPIEPEIPDLASLGSETTGGLDAELGLDDDFDDLTDFDEELGEETGGGFLSNVYLGGYAAGTYGKKASFETTGVVSYDKTPSFSYGGGALVGYKLGPIRAELEGMYSQTSRTTANSTNFIQQADDEVEAITTIAGLANAYYKMNFGSYGVFGGGSLGFAQFSRNFNGNDSKGTGLTYGPLAGLTYQFTSNIELAAQYRYLLASKIEMTNDVTSTTETLDLSQHQAMIALRYSF